MAWGWKCTAHHNTFLVDGSCYPASSRITCQREEPEAKKREMENEHKYILFMVVAHMVS